MNRRVGKALLACAAVMAGCGGTHHKPAATTATTTSPTTTSRTAPSRTAPSRTAAASGAIATTGEPQPNAATDRPRRGDWTRFDYDAQRSGVGPAHTGITADNVDELVTRTVHIDGTADSSAIELHDLRLHGRGRDVLFVTTSYGHTIAIEEESGRGLWEYRAPGARRLEGTAQITTATPVSDPDRRHLYAASPDGLIHKLDLLTGYEVRDGAWPARVTLDPREEKIGGALNLSGSYVIAVVGGYIQNHPHHEHYQGHVVTIDRASGRIVHVFNALCSDRHALIKPRTCDANDAAVWARSGAVVEPDTGRLLIATGNGHFNGRTRWGDSVLELSPDAGQLLHNWTPRNQKFLDDGDWDVGSTAPAFVHLGRRRLAIQGGKFGTLSLLDLDRLDGATQRAGQRTGGELQTIPTPGRGMMFTAPAVWRQHRRTHVFVGDIDGIAGYVVSGHRHPKLVKHWSSPEVSTSPIVAGGLLYAFDLRKKTLDIREPTTGTLLRALPAAVGHWNSPIVTHGRVVLPVGDYQLHQTQGVIYIYHLPGR